MRKRHRPLIGAQCSFLCPSHLCLHGIGHLLLSYTEYDVAPFAAPQVVRNTVLPNSTGTCYRSLFANAPSCACSREPCTPPLAVAGGGGWYLSPAQGIWLVVVPTGFFLCSSLRIPPPPCLVSLCRSPNQLQCHFWPWAKLVQVCAWGLLREVLAGVRGIGAVNTPPGGHISCKYNRARTAELEAPRSW